MAGDDVQLEEERTGRWASAVKYAKEKFGSGIGYARNRFGSGVKCVKEDKLAVFIVGGAICAMIVAYVAHEGVFESKIQKEGAKLEQQVEKSKEEVAVDGLFTAFDEKYNTNLGQFEKLQKEIKEKDEFYTGARGNIKDKIEDTEKGYKKLGKEVDKLKRKIAKLREKGESFKELEDELSGLVAYAGNLEKQLSDLQKDYSAIPEVTAQYQPKLGEEKIELQKPKEETFAYKFWSGLKQYAKKIIGKEEQGLEEEQQGRKIVDAISENGSTTRITAYETPNGQICSYELVEENGQVTTLYKELNSDPNCMGKGQRTYIGW
ncbi:hypothetical protein HZB88_03700 [archaeon]|nr:hypothetical protein [archaeon]